MFTLCLVPKPLMSLESSPALTRKEGPSFLTKLESPATSGRLVGYWKPQIFTLETSAQMQRSRPGRAYRI